MKKLLLRTVALFALSAGGSALAADMPAYKAPPPPPSYNWSGVYIGFNIGGQWSEVDRHFPNPTSGASSPDYRFQRIPATASSVSMPAFSTSGASGSSVSKPL
jgi:outer membrane immunogenic protein